MKYAVVASLLSLGGCNQFPPGTAGKSGSRISLNAATTEEAQIQLCNYID